MVYSWVIGSLVWVKSVTLLTLTQKVVFAVKSSLTGVGSIGTRRISDDSRPRRGESDLAFNHISRPAIEIPARNTNNRRRHDRKEPVQLSERNEGAKVVIPVFIT